MYKNEFVQLISLELHFPEKTQLMLHTIANVNLWNRNEAV